MPVKIILVYVGGHLKKDNIKLNSDGASYASTKIAGAGGLLRNSQGEWIVDYRRMIGTCYSNVAELWGLIDGLCLAWNLGYRKVIVEMDATYIVDMVLAENLSSWGPDNLLLLVHDIIF